MSLDKDTFDCSNLGVNTVTLTVTDASGTASDTCTSAVTVEDVTNVCDNCPDDPNKTEAGVCGCGIPDTDSDGDGTPDCNDYCPDDPDKTDAGVCGCGTADTDTDDDGTPDCNDYCPDDPNKTDAGVCGCGIADTDTDDDGTLDCNDSCPDDPNKTEAGICGCGTADTDTDGDGTADCNDNCPDDPNKTEAGICGCGIADTDSDGDGTPDCNDNGPFVPNSDQVDLDGDGVGDACFPDAVSPTPLGVPITLSNPCSDNNSVEATWMVDGQTMTSDPLMLDVGVHDACVTCQYLNLPSPEPSCMLMVVYDASAGFVTGGGWIVSPVGAYKEDPNMTGRANFGFVSKYKKGANVPTGETEFRFKSADLNFYSVAYEWLVVAGSKAMYKGTGTINGQGDYHFLISAIDGDLKQNQEPDKFRIKIWSNNMFDATGGVVYDNNLGDTAENADPTTKLGGGNIKIHKEKRALRH
jgi:hypothetical protein